MRCLGRGAPARCAPPAGHSPRRRRFGKQPAGALLRMPPPSPAMRHRLRPLGEEAGAAVRPVRDPPPPRAELPRPFLGADQGTSSFARSQLAAGLRASTTFIVLV